MDSVTSIASTGLAAQLYGKTEGVAPAAPKSELGVGPEAAESAGARFADVAAELVGAVREGETTAEAGLVGRADPHSVVTALASSEVAVQTAVTVRDKVVEAYQEILRMPV